MEKIKAHFRKIKCEICKNKLLSVYIRGKTTFKSLDNFYFCPSCNKIFQLNIDETKHLNSGIVIK